MLKELRIQNLAIIDHVELHFEAGFNVLTGETGAGKSIIIDGMLMMLGARADTTLVRTGSSAAIVEGVFELSGAICEAVLSVLQREELLEDDAPLDEITLTRELRENGRSVCRVNGRTVSLSILREIGDLLVDIHGQAEHLSLLQTKAHVNLLDRYAGTTHQRATVAEKVRTLNGIRRDLESLRQGERDASRRLDMLNFQIDEIEAAGLKAGEEDHLRDERTRLANAEKLARLTGQALQSLEGSSEAGLDIPGALDQVGEVVAAVEQLLRIDRNLQAQYDLAVTLSEQLDDLTRALISYRDEIEFNPERLDEIEERLALLANLKRKYGESIPEILAFAEKAKHDRDNITHASERIAALEKKEQALLQEIGQAGWALHQARVAAAETLARRVEAELQDLRMERARFKVDFVHTDDAHGAPLPDGRRVRFDATGIDLVEFLIAPNPGEGFKPLVKIASGGETARLMLALKSVLARADATPTLIFDEIDQGIGGRVGTTVGQKLWRLSDGHQVLCITHLPQLAGYGDAHFKVEKAVNASRTTTRVYPLEADSRVDELAQMLGTLSDSTRSSAREILSQVAGEKGS